MSDEDEEEDESSFISDISPLFSLSRLKKQIYGNNNIITSPSSPSVSTFGGSDEDSAYHVLPWRLFFNSSPSTPQQVIIPSDGNSLRTTSSSTAAASSSSSIAASTFNDKSPSTPRDVNQSDISMHTNISSPSSPTTKQRLFTPTSASKLLSNIYSHGSAGLRRKKALDTTTTCSDLTTNAHVDSPSTNVQKEEPFSYHNLFLTQYQQLKTYQYHQSTKRQSNYHIDQYHSTSYSGYIESTMLYSISHMLLILTISVLIIGTVFTIMYSYLTQDYTVFGSISSNIMSSLFIKPITISMSIITSIASQNIPGLNNNLFSIYPKYLSFTTTSSSSSVLSSNDFLCTIKINMISRPK
jgi:hypothetical protein